MVKILCSPATLTGKTIVDIQTENGVIPQTDVLNESLTENESWYQVAKEISRKATASAKAKVQGNASYFFSRPSEMLKDIDNGVFVEDVLDTYRGFSENYYDSKTKSFKYGFNQGFKYDFETGLFKENSPFVEYNPLLENLKVTRPVKFGYIKEWMRYLEDPGKHSRGVVSNAVTNIRDNLLKNSVSGALLNTTQLSMTTMPNKIFDHPEDFLNGVKMFLNDRKNGYKELKKEGVGQQRFFEDMPEGSEDFDLFTAPEIMNQGVTYFTGKAEAQRLGKTEAEAIKDGRVLNEKMNFISRPGNQPQVYWGQLKDSMALMSYTMQFSKLFYTNVFTNPKNAIGMMLMTTVLFGAEAVIPSPVWWFMKEEDRAEWKKIPSLFKSIGLDLTDSMRSGEFVITPVIVSSVKSLIASSGYVLDDMKKSIHEEDQESLKEPKFYKDLIRALKSGLIFFNPLKIGKIPAVGWGQVGEVAELARRLGFEDYDRTDWDTKNKYETSAKEEMLRIIGKPYSESKKVYGLD
ncbi:MAG: hypothetical protein U9P90_02285 [Patescibacteria group bacterium]|nr:hypothetical protein [Patescibacteria group bacterium]